MADFKLAIPFVLLNEGGLTNDPDDAGGITNFGLTKEDIAVYYGTPSVSVADDEIIDLTEDKAKEIYRALYWNKLCLDQVNDQELATVIFDCGVNQGTPTVARYIQKTVGTNLDGIIGALTLVAINESDSDVLIKSIYDQARAKYDRIVQRDSTQEKFYKGWMNRINQYLGFIRNLSA